MMDANKRDSGKCTDRQCLLSTFPNSSGWWWLISSVFLIRISCHKTTHTNGYYGAWPGWAVSVSVLPLTVSSGKKLRLRGKRFAHGHIGGGSKEEGLVRRLLRRSKPCSRRKTLSVFFKLSESQFPHLWNGTSNDPVIRGLGIIYAKYPKQCT